MIVEKVCYGKDQVSRIYVNGKIVWESRKTLPLSYNIYLTSDIDEDIQLTSASLYEFISGDFIWDLVGNTDSNITITDLNNHVHDVIIDAEDDNSDNYFIPILALQMYGDLFSVIGLKENNNGIGLPILNIFYTYNASIRNFFQSYAISADASIGNHLSQHNIDVDSVHTGLSAEAILGHHIADYKIKTTAIHTGLSANAKLGDHSAGYKVTITNSHTGLSATAMIGTHDADHHIHIYSNRTGLSAIAVVGQHDGGNHVKQIHVENGLAANAIYSLHDFNAGIKQDCIDTGISANAVQAYAFCSLLNEDICMSYMPSVHINCIFVEKVLIPVDDVDGCAQNINTALLQSDNECVVDYIDESFIKLVDLSKAYQDIISDITSNSDYNIDQIILANGFLDENASVENIDLNATEVEVFNIGFEFESVYPEESENNLNIIGYNELFSEESFENVENYLLNALGANIVSGSVNVEHSFDLGVKAVLSNEGEIIKPIYIDPIQTDTDLYIQQVIECVPNGSNLNLY